MPSAMIQVLRSRRADLFMMLPTWLLLLLPVLAELVERWWTIGSLRSCTRVRSVLCRQVVVMNQKQAFQSSVKQCFIVSFSSSTHTNLETRCSSCEVKTWLVAATTAETRAKKHRSHAPHLKTQSTQTPHRSFISFTLLWLRVLELVHSGEIYIASI